MVYEYFIDEYPAAIVSAKERVEAAYEAAKRNQGALPEYEAAKAHLRRLQYEYKFQQRMA